MDLTALLPLVAAGIKRIYGVVGDTLNGLVDAIRRQGKMEATYEPRRRSRGPER
jgi:thiamine pyrophosphate-dependent acetolactate synthase large subunit-like protein